MDNTKTMIVADFNEFKEYRMSCECSDPNHDMGIYINKDPKFSVVSIDFSMKLISKCKSPYIFSFPEIMFNRISIAFTILFKGYITSYEQFIISNPKVIDNMIQILEEGKQILEENEGEIDGWRKNGIN